MDGEDLVLVLGWVFGLAVAGTGLEGDIRNCIGSLVLKLKFLTIKAFYIIVSILWKRSPLWTHFNVHCPQ